MSVAELLLIVYAVLGIALLSVDPLHSNRCDGNPSFPCPLLRGMHEQDLRIACVHCIVGFVRTIPFCLYTKQKREMFAIVDNSVTYVRLV